MSDELFVKAWDVVVIGTGVGGGLVGRGLAERGHSVLFLEKGAAGWRTEESTISGQMEDPTARLLRGAWPDPIDVKLDGADHSFFAPLGCGVGGTSVFYAATLERPEPHELDRHWPVPYAEMARWYADAESIFELGLGHEAERQPGSHQRLLPPLGPADIAIMERLRANGLNPHRLNIALRYLPHCGECLGRKCPRDCKRDGRSAGVEPALASGQAALAVNCEVLRLVGEPGRVTGVEVRRDGVTFIVSASRIILAAGAFSSPRILLASASEAWPEGCGNQGGLVGRNLMLHLNEMFAIWPSVRKIAARDESTKVVGLRDLMLLDEHRLGMVQSLGMVAREGEILQALRLGLARSRVGRTRLVQEGSRIPAKIAARTLGHSRLFVGLLEDFPDPSNRVRFDPIRPERIAVEYHIPDELRVRRAVFRKAIRFAFRGLKPLFLNYEPMPNWGHPCGTTRMGSSPQSSVVDPSCRVHGIANLWVADAGVFPTSLGVNPSLTIAANALRVAESISRVTLQ